MAAIPQRGNSGFNLGGFLILAALGTFIWKGAPLDSVRPSSEQSGWYEQKLSQQVPARLWQDPFKAVHTHEQSIKPEDVSTVKKKNSISVINTALNNIESDVDLTLLMVLVTPGSYAVQEERRRRRRYAVLSALGEEHYVPRNPEILNVFYQTTADSTGSYSVPYEWYDYESPGKADDNKKQTLVLWLDESKFVDSPLAAIKTLLEGLLPADSNNNKFKAILMGPARSDTLRNLVSPPETQKNIDAADKTYQWLRCTSGLSEFNIFSSTATVDDGDLLRKQSSANNAKRSLPLSDLQQRITSSSCEPEVEHKTRISFLRTIRSDGVLIEKLADELKSHRLFLPQEEKFIEKVVRVLKNFWLTLSGNNEQQDEGNISELNDHVVVISEWDTYFGRSLPRAFEKHFCDSDDVKIDCGDNVVKYHYQRGMDGIIAGEHKSSTRTKTNKLSNTNAHSSSIDEASMRRPVGAGQFDYLRRLASDIKQKNNEWRLESGYGVGAVVLLGSDVYDKLLILRALRPQLPGAVFATTDLDAQLLHPAEYNWTRNMIVASTYDLALSPQIPMSTMPFRNSYQTSVYLSTRLAFNKDMQAQISADQYKMNAKIPPQLMEVGRQELVPLLDGADKGSTWNHVAVKSFAPAISLGVLIIALLAIFAFHQLRPMAGRVVVVLSLLLLLFSALAVLIWFKGNSGEPVSLLAGASIWPAESIRLLGVILAMVYIWSAINILHKSWKELEVRYFKKGEEYEDVGVTVAQVWAAFKTKLTNPEQIKKNIKLSRIFPLAMIALMILIMKSVLPVRLPLDEKIWLLVVIWGSLIVFWWLLIYGHLNKNFKVLSVNKWNADCVPDDKDAVKMWHRYGEYGAGDQRFIRTIAYILIYFAFASILFAILGPPASPCRGAFACNLDKMILGFSVLSMLVLLFFVVDAARLCICWVDSMHKHDLDWSNTRKAEFIQRLRLPDAHAVAWMKVHLIGERTSEVTRLIYFPVMIILLLLLARSTYFDNWDFPQALAIVIGLNFIIALGSVVRLNFVAQATREDILRKLQDEQLAGDRVEDKSYEPSSSERQELIDQLQNLQIGAYLRVWDQPPVRATIMLLGGVALTSAEYFTMFL